MRLNVSAFALALGILGGVGMFLATWWVMLFEGPVAEPTLIATFYRGYPFTPLGSLIGAIWGFLDGLIAGAAFAWLYNALVLRV